MNKLIQYLKTLENSGAPVYVPISLIGDDSFSQDLLKRGLLIRSNFIHKATFTCPRCGQEEEVIPEEESFLNRHYFIICKDAGIWEKLEIPSSCVESIQFDLPRFHQLLENGEIVYPTFGKQRTTPSQWISKKKIPIPEDRQFKTRIKRFLATARTSDIKLFDPNGRWEKCTPYYDITTPTTAYEFIKELLAEYNKSGSEGWCKSKEVRTAFPRKYQSVYRFKNEQIEVGSRGNGHSGEWRIIPDCAFDEHYRKRIVHQEQ